MAGSLIVGTMVLLAGIVNLEMIPHPLSFSAAGVVLYLPAAMGERTTAARMFQANARSEITQ